MKDLAVRPAPPNGRISRRIGLTSFFAMVMAATVLLPQANVAGSTLEDRLKAVGPGVHQRTIVWQDEVVPSALHRVQLLIVDRSYLAPSGPLVISATSPTVPLLFTPTGSTETKTTAGGEASGGPVSAAPGPTSVPLGGTRPSPPQGGGAAPGVTTSSPASTLSGSSLSPGTTLSPVAPVLLAGLREEIPDASAYPDLAGIRISGGELLYASSGIPAVGILLNGQPVSGLPLLWAKAEPLRPSGLPYLSVSIDRVNLPHSNGVTYYTPAFGKTTGTEPGTTEFVLAAKDGKTLVRPGPDTEFEAVVVSVRRSGNSNIPAEGAVLAVSGPEASRLSSYLTNGQSVRLTFQLIPDQWRTAREVIPGEHLLLASRVVRPLPAGTPGLTSPSAHVAFAYNDKVLLFVIVDDSASVSGPEWAGAPSGLWRAEGLTLTQLARILQDMGMADAVSLPARFSLYVNAEETGTSKVSSDQGAVRLGIWNTAPAGSLFLIQIEGGADRVLAGSRFSLQATGFDTGFHPIPLSPTSLSWSLLTSNVSLEKQGTTVQLVAQAPGRAAVRAEVLTPEGLLLQRSWEGEVVAPDRLRQITLSPAFALRSAGQSLSFTVTGWDEAGRPVYVDPGLLVWDVPAFLGHFDPATGTLLPSTRISGGATSFIASGPTTGGERDEPYFTGEIRASLRARPDLSATAQVTLGPAPQPLTDLSTSGSRWVLADPQVGNLRLVAAPLPRPAPVGPLMLQPVVKTGTSGREVVIRPQLGPTEALTLTKEARALGLWIYTSRDQAVSLTAEWTDAVGRLFNSSFTPFDSTGNPPKTAVLQLKRGWHFLIASVPATAAAPVTLTGLRLVMSGQQGPVDLDSGFPGLGALLELSIIPSAPSALSALSAPSASGTPIMLGAGVPANIEAVSPSLLAFSELQPAEGQVIPTPTPRFSVRFRLASGWEPDVASLRFSLDGKVVWSRELANSAWGRLIYGEGGFDRSSGFFWFMPVQPLSTGRHQARLEFTLIATNASVQSTVAKKTVELEWQFTVAPVSVPATSRARPLRIAVVGGPALTGVADEPGERIFREIIRRLNERLARADAPDLVVITGDMTATSSESLYARAVQLLQTLKIPYLVIPGRRDLDFGGNISRDRFLKTWGLTCGRLDIGSTRLLLLDTVEGVGGHDPTQWDWFARELENTADAKISRLVIFSYRSPLIPAGWPQSAETEKLISLLSARTTSASSVGLAKAATQSSATPEIIFISGSPAAFLAQQDRGILYLTSGGGGREPEAPPDAGGFYHWLELDLPIDGPARWSVVPLVQSITLGGLPDKLRVNGSVTPWAVADLYTASRPPLRITVQPPLAYKWSVSDPRLATIDPVTGELTAKAPGKVQVTLEVGGVRASRQLEIIPN